MRNNKPKSKTTVKFEDRGPEQTHPVGASEVIGGSSGNGDHLKMGPTVMGPEIQEEGQTFLLLLYQHILLSDSRFMH